MILSHKHKFIFLKTNKTAGTSVEVALSKFCGPEDIITPISPKDELIRREMGFRGPQNCYASLTQYGALDIANLIRGRRKLQFYNHMSAHSVRALVSKEIWDNYYKFTIERNPWDRFVSFYFWRCREEPRPSMLDFISTSPKMALLKERGIDLYSVDGEVVVDKICKFESLQDDLNEVANTLGLPSTIDLPITKAGTRKDKRHYSEVLDGAEREAIGRMFAKEIEMLNYSFDK